MWATGFDFGTGALARMGIRGRDGLALVDYWADGPRTFLGVQTHGFPNLFFPGGPHAAAGNNPRYNGDQVDFITDLLVYARDTGVEVIEVTERAEERWTNMVNRGALAARPSARAATTSAPTSPASRSATCSTRRGRPKLFSVIADVVANGYDSFTSLDEATEPTGPRPTGDGARPAQAVTPWRSASPASPPRRASAAAGR